MGGGKGPGMTGMGRQDRSDLRQTEFLLERLFHCSALGISEQEWSKYIWVLLVGDSYCG